MRVGWLIEPQSQFSVSSRGNLGHWIKVAWPQQAGGLPVARIQTTVTAVFGSDGQIIATDMATMRLLVVEYRH